MTKVEYEALEREVTGLIRERLEKLAGQGEGVTVFNTLGFDRDDVVDLGDVKGLRPAGRRGQPVPRPADGERRRGLPARSALQGQP